ncbi:MAG: TonB-dependent receptor [Alphaproteobacteria bacterium]|nr:TonB-dependent receptor [Alphaproteobacteria bacterium]
MGDVMRLRGFACALLALSWNTLACADDTQQTEKVIVTATRLPQPQRETGSDVTVIDEAEIKRRGATFVVDVLRGQPGLTVTQTGGPGGQISVRLRGEEGYRTLLLVDGIKVSDPSGTQNLSYFTNLPASGIERIEIVRGPQSLLYGAEAIGGVINVITKRGAPGLQYGGTALAGSFGTTDLQAYVRGASGIFDWALQGDRYDTDGFTAQEGPGFSENDGFKNKLLHAVLGVTPDTNTRVEAVMRYTDSAADFDRFFDSNSVLYTQQFAGALSGHGAWDDQRITADAKVAYFEQNRADYENGVPYSCPPFSCGSRFDSGRWRGEASGSIELMPGQRLLVGGDVERETALTDFLDKSRESTGVYGEWIAHFGEAFFATAGLRFDDDDQFGGHLTWRATAAYLVPLIDGIEPVKFRASYGTGFRAPSLFELYDAFSGNPNLHEETGRGADAGVDFAFPHGTVSLTAFDQRIDDEIRFDQTSFFTYFQSPSTSTSRGVELEVTYELIDGLTLSGDYTYTDAKIASNDTENGLARVRRPRHSGSITANYAFLEGRANLNANFQFAAKQEDLIFPPPYFLPAHTPLDGQAVINLAGSYEFVPGITLLVKGVNVFDERYEEALGFKTQGASVYAGVSAAF